MEIFWMITTSLVIYVKQLVEIGKILKQMCAQLESSPSKSSYIYNWSKSYIITLITIVVST